MPNSSTKTLRKLLKGFELVACQRGRCKDIDKIFFGFALDNAQVKTL